MCVGVPGLVGRFRSIREAQQLVLADDADSQRPMQEESLAVWYSQINVVQVRVLWEMHVRRFVGHFAMVINQRFPMGLDLCIASLSMNALLRI